MKTCLIISLFAMIVFANNIHKNDSLALIKLKRANKPFTMVTWDETKPISTWNGVVLNDSGRVIEVSIAEERNMATIPSEIGDLNALKILRLDHTSVKALPPEIGKLTQLNDLGLDGTDIKYLPKEILQCTKLVNFYIGDCSEVTKNNIYAFIDRNKISKLRAFLKTMDKKDLSSSKKAVTYFKKQFTTCQKDINDSAFLLLDIFHKTLAKNESHTEAFEDVIAENSSVGYGDVVMEVDGDSPEAQYLREVMRYGYVYAMGPMEFSHYPFYCQLKENFLIETYGDYLSEQLYDIIQLELIEDAADDYTDGNWESSPLDFLKRIIQWEQLLIKYPDSKYKTRMREKLKSVLSTFAYMMQDCNYCPPIDQSCLNLANRYEKNCTYYLVKDLITNSKNKSDWKSYIEKMYAELLFDGIK